MSELSCPLCGGEDTQALSHYVALNTSVGKSTSIGTVQNVGAVTATSSSTHASALAKAHPEPKKDNLPAIFIGVLVVSGIVGLINAFLGAIAWIGGLVILALGYRHNRYRYPGLIDAWRRSWICHRCGHVFRLEPHSHPTATRAA